MEAPHSRRQARGTHKSRTVPLPQRRGSEKTQADPSDPGSARPHRRPSGNPGLEAETFLLGVRWQVRGNKGNLGPAPRAACVVLEFALGPAWESLSACASLRTARWGPHKAPCQELNAPTPPVGLRPAMVRVAVEDRGARDPGGAGRAWRQPGELGGEGGAVAAEERSEGGRVESRHGYCSCTGI